MKGSRARDILQSLVGGIDPKTGAELPPDSPLQDSDVLRALLAGVTALDAVIARVARRAQLPQNVGKPWSEEEETRLVADFKAKVPLPEIATRFGRSVRGIVSRLQKLKLVSLDQNQTAYGVGRNPQPTAPKRRRRAG